jgi:hypothetical protein
MRVICRECGSEDVVRDAWVRWDASSQAWEIATTLPAAYCHQCDGEVALDHQPELMS